MAAQNPLEWAEQHYPLTRPAFHRLDDEEDGPIMYLCCSCSEPATRALHLPGDTHWSGLATCDSEACAADVLADQGLTN